MIQAIPTLQARLSACRGVLVDSNILLDIATSDPNWSDWSGRPLAECAEHTTLIINPIIYAEVSIGYPQSKRWMPCYPQLCISVNPYPGKPGSWPGSASCCTAARGGLRSSTLPDFYIGAHAAIGHLAPLTRDAVRYRSYFPSIEILDPQNRGCDAVARIWWPHTPSAGQVITFGFRLSGRQGSETKDRVPLGDPALRAGHH